MRRWQKILFYGSRSQTMLWLFAVATLATGTAIGALVHVLRPNRPENLAERIAAAVPWTQVGGGIAVTQPDVSVALLSALARELTDPSVDFEHVILAIPDLADLLREADPALLGDILRRRFSPEEVNLAVDFLAALNGDDAAATARLEAAAEAAAPVRHANFALGVIAQGESKFAEAARRFLREGENADAADARRRAVEALVAARDTAELTRLEADPRYRESITPRIRLQIAVQRQDWPGILHAVPAVQVSSFEPAILVLTAIAGLAWAFLLLQLGEVRSLASPLPLLCLTAFVCGVVSTTLTIYVVIWQDEILHFSEGPELVRTLVYCVGGIGAREELCKLALFVPWLPFLLRRDDEMEAFLVASFVGLGFAIEENGNYFLMSRGAGAAGRFLTANFFHVALTGANGLYLFRAWGRGFDGLNEFLYVLALTIVVHGLYDALLMTPGFDASGYLAMAVLVGFSVFYFNRAHELRRNVRATMSLTGTFVVGISVLAAAVIAFHVGRLGVTGGLSIMLPELLGSAVLLFLFFREFREPMAA